MKQNPKQRFLADFSNYLSGAGENAQGSARYHMEKVGDLYQPMTGFFQKRFAQPVEGIKTGDWIDKAVYSVLGTGLMIPTLIDSIGTGVYNAPNQFYKAAIISITRQKQITQSNV